MAASTSPARSSSVRLFAVSPLATTTSTGASPSTATVKRAVSSRMPVTVSTGPRPVNAFCRNGSTPRDASVVSSVRALVAPGSPSSFRPSAKGSVRSKPRMSSGNVAFASTVKVASERTSSRGSRPSRSKSAFSSSEKTVVEPISKGMRTFLVSES